MMEWHSIDNYYIGDGFNSREESTDDSWHWALQNRAFIGMDFKSESKRHVWLISFELEPPPNGKERSIEIYLNHTWIDNINAPSKHQMRFVGMPNTFYELEFISKGKLTQVPGDTRSFAFMLKNFKLERVDENLEVSNHRRLVQKKHIEILEKYINLCKENNLTYYAFYGTLLGAVRHQGFIPWDDDIDVVMPRKDFNKFVQLMDEAKEDDYYFNSMESNHNCFYGGYGKFGDKRTTFITKRDANQKSEHGITIDIFPLDGFEVKSKKRHNQLKRLCFLQELAFVKIYHRRKNLEQIFSSIKWLQMKFWCMLYSKNKIIKKLTQVFEENQYSSHVTILARYLKDDNRKFYKKDFFSNPVELQFENLKINVPGNFDACLRVDYGKAYLLYPDEGILRKSHCGIACVGIPYREFEEHVLYHPIQIKNVIIIGDLEIIKKYLEKDKSRRDMGFVLDLKDKSSGAIINGHMIIGINEVQQYYNKNYTILICTEAFEPIVEAMQKNHISNYYIYIDDCMW